MSTIQCTLCPNYCVLKESGRGKCGIRINLDGQIYSLTYGHPCAMHVDPIEKKPAYHFLPGTTALSIATAGCCLDCKYCQNWQISQSLPEETTNYDLPPDSVVKAARSSHAKTVAYTYTEPSVFFEYMLDTAKAAKKRGLNNYYVTCGYINPEPLAELTPYIDGANVDLKGFSDDFYFEYTGGSLDPVLRTIKYLYAQGVIVEITNLVVPTVNDSLEMISGMCNWLANEVSPDIPVHFSRFYPNYKLKNLPPTPIQTMKEARAAAIKAGLKYVYLGNVEAREAQNTVCPACANTVVERIGYKILSQDIKDGKCGKCGHKIYGKW